MTQLLPSNEPKPEPSKPSPTPKNTVQGTSIILATALGLALALVVGVLPRLGNQAATEQTVSTSPTTVTMQDNEQDNSSMRVLWDSPVTQPQFWFNNRLVKITCDTQTCTVPKPTSTEQVYFRWVDTSDNKAYYFTCNGDYRGRFKGLPVAAQ